MYTLPHKGKLHIHTTIIKTKFHFTHVEDSCIGCRRPDGNGQRGRFPYVQPQMATLITATLIVKTRPWNFRFRKPQVLFPFLHHLPPSHDRDGMAEAVCHPDVRIRRIISPRRVRDSAPAHETCGTNGKRESLLPPDVNADLPIQQTAQCLLSKRKD